MTSIPEISVTTQTIEATRLPVGSYRQRGLPYGRFQPFEMLGDLDALGNNQLNWTNLFLLNRLGSAKLHVNDIIHTDTIINTKEVDEASIKQIKRISRELSGEFEMVKAMIENMNNSDDLERIREEITKIRYNKTLEAKLLDLEDLLKDIKRTVNAIAARMDA